MSEEYDRNLKWGTIRGYIPALSKYMANVDMLEVRRLLRGAFNRRPPKKRYTAIWSVNIVLDFMASMITTSLMDKTRKLVTILMLLSGNRVNMLSHMKITNMYLTEGECTFVFDEVLKQDRPNFDTSNLTYRAFPEFKVLCPVNAIKEYLEERLLLSGSESFLVTTTIPHHRPAASTIAGWIKEILGLAGIDSGKFTAHSCRSASTSNAYFQGISLKTILKSASWKGDHTFKKHYLREIESLYNQSEENFGYSTLEAYIKVK